MDEVIQYCTTLDQITENRRTVIQYCINFRTRFHKLLWYVFAKILRYPGQNAIMAEIL